MRRRLSTELAQASGRALYGETAPGADAVRRVLRPVESLTEDSRTEAQSFTLAGPAIFLAVAENPPSGLLAASKDSGVNCGEVLKRLLGPAGGRGGGNATLAQGSLPSKAALQELAESLSRELNFPTTEPRP